jgi:hypothetical protein
MAVDQTSVFFTVGALLIGLLVGYVVLRDEVLMPRRPREEKGLLAGTRCNPSALVRTVESGQSSVR